MRRKSGTPGLPYDDRAEAGAFLAKKLSAYQRGDTVVLGLTRGGIPVAIEVARALDADLDVLVTRKVFAPGRPDLAIGAIAPDGGRFLDEKAIHRIGLSHEEVAVACAQAKEAARRRDELLHDGRRPVPVEGRVVLLVDDGIATGATMRVAIRSLRPHRPARIVVAVPVGSLTACAALRREAEEVVCPAVPEPFDAIGAYYLRFEEIEDHEVVRLLAEHEKARAPEAVFAPS